jgi:Alw26I/Eco31I/Esp3I family type II restriction m6 adenine DNA methyltransferase
MAAPRAIQQLVDRFHRNLDQYRSQSYNETQVRREFLDPLFGALGWDVTNQQGYAEQYKEVIHEDQLRVGSSTKAPDYCFRIGGTRKFFLEAKKPAVNIKDSTPPAFQLRRYAWSAKLSLSVLSDFEEFSIYDCRSRPSKADKASTGRTAYFTYTDYYDRWDEIAAIFSKEAVLMGSFDRYATASSNRKGTATVDGEFLKELESWRRIIAKNIADKNKKLGCTELSYAVQRTLDRIIFLRICEDRGIEPHGQLQALLDGEGVYKRLVALFEKADDRYNSGLFHFHKESNRPEPPDELSPKLKIEDGVLKEVLNSLYYPESPYEFSVMPADILGHIYERFLGQVITLDSSRRVVIKDKLDNRKSGGVFYTPTNIVEHIVKSTVGSALSGLTPVEASKLTIVDPSCGSGSFLLGAYQYLLDWNRNWYANNNPENHVDKVVKTHTGGWRLSISEKKRILLNNIYGVDIDAQAVETTKLSLLLKLLEDENHSSVEAQLARRREKALPDLGENIKCGNSLIDSKGPAQLKLKLSLQDALELNAFDWQKEFPKAFSRGSQGFDVVIGNPPYDVVEKDRLENSKPHRILQDHVRASEDYAGAKMGKLNLYRLFLVRSLAITKTGGHFGMIVPMAIMADISCSDTRKHLLSSSNELHLDCFPQKDNANRRVFADAKLSTVVIRCTKERAGPERESMLKIRVHPWNGFTDPFKEAWINPLDLQLLDPEKLPIPLVDEAEWQLCRKLHASGDCTRLGEVPGVVVNRGEINQTVYKKFIKDKEVGNARLLKGVEVGPFEIRAKMRQGKRQWFDEKAYLQVSSAKDLPTKRRISTQRITGVDDTRRLIATIVEPLTYFADSTNSVSLATDCKYSLEYIVALLNSHLYQWRFRLTSTNNNVGTGELEAMPFKMLDFSVRKEKDLHDRITAEVKNITQLKIKASVAKTSSESQKIERLIIRLELNINKLVNELFGLNEFEATMILNCATGASSKTAQEAA